MTITRNVLEDVTNLKKNTCMIKLITIIHFSNYLNAKIIKLLHLMLVTWCSDVSKVVRQTTSHSEHGEALPMHCA